MSGVFIGGGPCRHRFPAAAAGVIPRTAQGTLWGWSMGGELRKEKLPENRYVVVFAMSGMAFSSDAKLRCFFLGGKDAGKMQTGRSGEKVIKF